MSANFIIHTIPHGCQRYPTVGDWEVGTGFTPHRIWVSQCGNHDYEFLVALHELIEFWLCHKRGISQSVVDQWDTTYKGDEPGDDPQAPYHREHTFASAIENLVAHELGVSLADYDAALDKLE